MTDKDLNFDLTTAITVRHRACVCLLACVQPTNPARPQVLRQAKYYTQAMYLAKKFQKHEW